MGSPTPSNGAAVVAALNAATVSGGRARQRAVARRSREATLMRLRAGYDVVGSTAPFGFEREGGRRVVHPVQWPPVQWLFTQALQTPSIAQLSREFAEATSLTRMAPLSARRIAQILRDPIYVSGHWKASYAGHTLAMPRVHLADPVDAVTFQNVQDLLKRRARPRPSPPRLTSLPPRPELLLTLPPKGGWPGAD